MTRTTIAGRSQDNDRSTIAARPHDDHDDRSRTIAGLSQYDDRRTIRTIRTIRANARERVPKTKERMPESKRKAANARG